ncbi:hypothetical protein KAI68_06520 [bacterium]|nr:hypothetical protein [bacterium]
MVKEIILKHLFDIIKKGAKITYANIKYGLIFALVNFIWIFYLGKERYGLIEIMGVLSGGILIIFVFAGMVSVIKDNLKNLPVNFREGGKKYFFKVLGWVILGIWLNVINSCIFALLPFCFANIYLLLPLGIIMAIIIAIYLLSLINIFVYEDTSMFNSVYATLQFVRCYFSQILYLFFILSLVGMGIEGIYLGIGFLATLVKDINYVNIVILSVGKILKEIFYAIFIFLVSTVLMGFYHSKKEEFFPKGWKTTWKKSVVVSIAVIVSSLLVIGVLWGYTQNVR